MEASVSTSDLYQDANLYCAAFDWPVDSEVDWLLSQFPKARTVLEPFCGNARYGPAFVQRDLEYWGVEKSEAMIQRAPRDRRIHLVHADARFFTIENVKFDLAWCPINSIRHLLTDHDIVLHLEIVRRHMAQGGVYVVESDLIRRDGLNTDLHAARGSWTMEQTDGSIVQTNWQTERYHLASRRMFERASIWHRRDDKIVREISHLYEMRMLTFEDWRDVIYRSGFEVSDVFQHRSSTDRPRVDVSIALENGPDNYYFVLRPGS